MKKSTCLAAVVVLFWAAMSGLHIHREFFRMAPVLAPYEVLSIHNLRLREEYRGIYLGDHLIGFSMTALEATSGDKEQDKKERDQDIPSSAETIRDYELRQNTYMSFLFLGEEREMLVRTKALLDPRLELRSFELKITSGEYWTDMKGRVEGDKLELIIEDRDGNPVTKNYTVERPLFYSESLPMLWTPENLRPGKQGSLRVWNPLMMGFETIDFRVERKINFPFSEEPVQVYPVVLSENGIETRYWITPEGIVLRNVSPTGLTLIKEEAWSIFDRLRESRDALTDLPNLYSIPSNRELPEGGALQTLSARVKTPSGEREITVEKKNLTNFSAVPYPLTLPPPDTESLKATEFIQSDHPDIKKKAAEITAGKTSAIDAARALMTWVHGYVKPTPTISIPSALQVYRLGEGDCNEYTVLFTALARAAGIPTRMAAGLVYQKGRFFYHAWPEIYLGEWVGLDPTFNQIPNDATHIPLVTGDLEEQVSLIKQMGQMELTVLDAR